MSAARFRPGLVAAAAVTLALLTVACGDDSDATATTGAAVIGTTTAAAAGDGLEGRTWVLTAATPLGVDLGTVTVTARFDTGTVSGQGGCNTYRGPYTLQGTALRIGPDLATTLLACPPPETAVEAAYLQRLPLVASYAISGSTLTLADGSGAPLLVYESSSGPAAIAGEWTVVNYYTGSAVTGVTANATLTAAFEADRVSGSGGCNRFNGPVTVTGESIQIGPLASTRMACPSPDLQAQETAYLAALQLATRFSAAGNRLDLFRADGGLAVVLTR